MPIAATPGSLGLVSWSESGDRYVAYHCAVYPLANGQWSGRSTITPSGWSIGGGPLDRRVCRYSADLDASGAVDANLEHPGSYSGVAESLAQQDFLVIKGSAICPGAAAQSVEGRGSDVFANLGTLPHQP